MATDNLNVTSTSALAGLDPTAGTISSFPTSLLSIMGIDMTAAGVLAGGVAVSGIAVDTVR